MKKLLLLLALVLLTTSFVSAGICTDWDVRVYAEDSIGNPLDNVLVAPERKYAVGGWNDFVPKEKTTGSDGYTSGWDLALPPVWIQVNYATLDGYTCTSRDSTKKLVSCGMNTLETVCTRDPYCGDGAVNQQSETCDDGNKDNTDSCTTSCIGPVCGDSFVQSSNYEECDDSNSQSNDGCSVDCKTEECGDGIQQTGEECDVGTGNFEETCTPGYEDSCMVCKSNCKIYSGVKLYCGDSIKNGPEECDGTDGVADHYQCQNNCVLTYIPYCGDNSINLGEVCDNGDQNGATTCTPDYNSICTLCNVDCSESHTIQGPYCGDGNVDAREECDGGKNCEECKLTDVDVPEFGALGAALVIVLSGLALAVLRKR